MKKVLLPLLILGFAVLSNRATSQKIFMKVNASGYNFDGGSQVMHHEKEIDVLSFSNGLVGCSIGSGNGQAMAGQCKPSLSDMSIMTTLSLATIDFRSAMLKGKTLSDVDMMVASNSGGSEFTYYRIHMENVTITSVQEGGSAGGDKPTISISLSPEKIAWQVITQNATGGQGPASSFGWDFSKNSPFNYSF